MRFAKKCGIYLCIGLLVIVCVTASVVYNAKTKTYSVAEIVSDGEVIETVDLSKVTGTYEIEVNTESGYNKISVEPGRIAVIEADCPDKICVNQGYIEAGNLPIVCLPHKLTITMKGGGKIDAVSGK